VWLWVLAILFTQGGGGSNESDEWAGKFMK
jgi:hypothetical protein